MTGEKQFKKSGIFAAHADTRSKGFLTKAARDRASVIEFKLHYLSQPIPIDNIHPTFARFFLSTARYIDDKTLKKQIGVSKIDCDKIVRSVIKNVTRLPNGHYTLINPTDRRPLISAREFKVTEYLMRLLYVEPAFTGERLYTDFCSVLKSQGLLQKTELKDFSFLSPAIQLFAISVMHRSEILLESGERAKLRYSEHLGPKESALGVSLTIDLDKATFGVPIGIATSIFLTDLRGDDHCAAELLRLPDADEYALTVNPYRRLTLL